MRHLLRLLFVIVAVLGPISACEDDPNDLDYLKGGSGGSSGSSGKGAAGAGRGGAGAGASGGGGSSQDVDAGD